MAKAGQALRPFILIKPKKSLGQNFLKSSSALRSIITAGAISSDDIILEIGPGTGILTEKILEAHPKKIICVEKDDRLISFLHEKFHQEIAMGALEIMHADILEFNEEDIRKYGSHYKLIANIPYYITGAVLRKFLSGNNQPKHMVVLLQKEVAKRIVAHKDQGKKESLLSMSVKAYGTPRYIETVQAKYFSPAPKVDSAILSIEHISKDFFKTISEEKFFEVLKAGFAHKRKVLISNLRTVFPEAHLEKIFEECKLSVKIRAEDIGLDDWLKLAKKIV